MSHVSVTIAGRAYRMACHEGQEEHLMSLGRFLDSKIDMLRASFGEIGDMRLAVMAGIMVADEMQDIERRARALEREVETLRGARASANAREDETETRLLELVSAAASRLERLADALHRGGVSA
jgi:cell division protein ZapA